MAWYPLPLLSNQKGTSSPSSYVDSDLSLKYTIGPEIKTRGVEALSVGEIVGAPVGEAVGALVGEIVGSPVGEIVGAPVGEAVGEDVCVKDGVAVGLAASLQL